MFTFTMSSFAQLQGVKICIDPGHGGHDGANDRRIELPHGIIFWESEGNFMTANHEKDLLTALGANVKMTRTGNDDSDDISLSSRSAIANAFGADYFQSNHTNAGSSGANYSLVLFKGEDNNPAWPDAKAMGAIMGPNLQDLLETNKNHNRGDKSFLGFNLGVLRNTNMPATLSEGSFHDLPQEGLRLKNVEYSKNYAWALAKSFCKYFKVDGFSTGRVGGIVKDRNIDKVINNIKVTCTPGDKTYVGDEFYNGVYAIGELNPGQYTLTFSRSGYFEVKKTVTIKANKYTKLNVSLPVDNNGAPFVYFEVDGLPAGTGKELIFDASKSADNGQIVSYEWEFGDGTAADTGKIVKHTYNADGNYIASLKVTDDEGKVATLDKTIPIVTTPPSMPTLLSAELINDNKGVKLKWKKNTQDALAGYRIYYASNLDIENIQVLADTNILTPNITELSIDSIGEDHIYHFWLKAVNIAGQESPSSDMYGVMDYPFDTNKKLLIVDGFHRRSSYPDASHTFASTTYLLGLHDALGHVNVSTCLNESVISGKIKLADYDIVMWFLGDESTVDETFNPYEQNKVKDYLRGGGKLFVSGAEIGWDLDHKGSSTDKSFYNDYLKAEYVSDGENGLNPAKGLSDFNGVKLNFSQVYKEDYPDVISGSSGAKTIFKYNDGSVSGIAYKGKFGGSNEGAVVNLGFALETVKDKTQLKTFFEKLLKYFDTTVSIPEIFNDKNKNIFDVYPTIFSDLINIESKEAGDYTIEIFNLQGEKFYKKHCALNRNEKDIIKLNSLNNGLYILKISNNNTSWTGKIIKK